MEYTEKTQNDIISDISPNKDYKETLWRKLYAETTHNFLFKDGAQALKITS